MIIIVGVAFWLIRGRGKETGLPSQTQTTGGTQPTAKIKISGVEVNDFQKGGVSKNNQGDSLFVNTSDYQIAYIPKDNLFMISILGSPFTEVQKRAETNFLRELGIEKEKACQLKVSITTPYFANPAESGKTYKLSFCQ